MKKEYLILILLILGLSAYLFFHNENAGHYTLPEIAKLEPADIGGLVISNDSGTVELVQKDKSWFLKGNDYPADPVAVQDMLDALASFKLSALVSQKKDFNRYELDDENKIKIRVNKKDGNDFEFTLGKVASTMNHTFVMLKDDTNVYQASGAFRTYFADSSDGYRDKKVLKFPKESITQFTVQKNDLKKSFSREQAEKKEKQDDVWKDADNQVADRQILTDLFSSLSDLECETYPEKDDKQEFESASALYTVQLKNKDNFFDLKLFLKKGEEKSKGISSTSPYVFELSKFNTDDITSNLDKLLGIEEEEKKD